MTAAGSIVFVLDDDELMREALVSLIRSVGLHAESFSSAREFLARARVDVPCCLVLDVRLPGPSGLDLQSELAAAGEQIPIIFITGHGDIAMSVRAMKAGAVEFLPKPFREQDLLDAIALALDRSRTIRARHAEIIGIRRRCESLTTRERAVMTRVVQGMLNKQVAAELGVSEMTVKVHRRNVMEKMGAASFADLVRMIERLSSH
jgi:FixJ family two-component response regulator